MGFISCLLGTGKVAIFHAGICIIFGDRLLIPLVTVNFSALPFLFKSLHLSISLGSLYLPNVLGRYQRQSCISSHVEVSFEECRLYTSHIHVEAFTSRTEAISFENLSANKSDVGHASQILSANKVSHGTGTPESAARNTTIKNNVRFQKNPRKRSSLRPGRVPGRSLSKHRRKGSVGRPNGTLKVDTDANVCHTHKSFIVESVCEKMVDTSLHKICTGEHVPPSPTPNQKRRRCTRRNSVQRLKEPKSVFSEAKQNIDMLSCTGNILVIESDRCWREEGAKVMLELSSSNEWCLAIKSGDITRYLHKAQEMKPIVTNRYTHAMMWTGDSGWKLEFFDKKDWNVFKELHKECCERNVQEVSVRVIPVPGVQEVSGYEESLTSAFLRPNSYIRMVDEVERVLISEHACYDMDSGDDEWLKRLNSSSLSGETDSFTPISEDNFEKIVSTFEKAAYCHPDDVSEADKAATLCSNLGRSDVIAAVFDYWMKKRKQKRSALVRVFQGQPPRRTQQTQKPLLRKKRSLKRQGSHAGRRKPEVFLEAAARQDAICRLQEAEADVSRAVDVAIRLRSRAQVLMTNADLATYKSVMALRLAEAHRESESSDLSFILS
uniref:Enhancer of polycomb-like protein n=1 Tax=Anthurium amnicola TaxID=1678845 RepID=A0A1D1YL59_9ARAE